MSHRDRMEEITARLRTKLHVRDQAHCAPNAPTKNPYRNDDGSLRVLLAPLMSAFGERDDGAQRWATFNNRLKSQYMVGVRVVDTDADGDADADTTVVTMESSTVSEHMNALAFSVFFDTVDQVPAEHWTLCKLGVDLGLDVEVDAVFTRFYTETTEPDELDVGALDTRYIYVDNYTRAFLYSNVHVENEFPRSEVVIGCVRKSPESDTVGVVDVTDVVDDVDTPTPKSFVVLQSVTVCQRFDTAETWAQFGTSMREATRAATKVVASCYDAFLEYQVRQEIIAATTE